MTGEKYIIPKSDIEIKKDETPVEETTTFSFTKVLEKQVEKQAQIIVAQELKKIEENKKIEIM